MASIFARHGVVAAYVFGSLARGRDPARVTDRSDLDLALLFPASLTRTERWERSLQVGRDLDALFNRGDMDVVVANDAPIVLRNRIVRERDVVYGRNAPERVAFDWSTLREYLDTEPMRQVRYRAMLRRAREGRFGVRPGDSVPAAR